MYFEALKTLAEFGTRFRNGISDDVAVDDGLVADFSRIAYDECWVDESFDWTEWSQQERAQGLITRPMLIAGAKADELFHLITTFARKDKFVDGTLKNAFLGGYIAAICRRAMVLSDPRHSPFTSEVEADEEPMVETGGLSVEQTDQAAALPDQPGLMGPDEQIKKLSSKQSGTLGELLALAKFNSLGYLAYVSPEGAPGHDLIVMIGTKALSVEVKTRQFVKRATEITRWPVDMKTKGDADLFLFVELDMRTLTPGFYLLDRQQAWSCYTIYGDLGTCQPPAVRKLVPRNDFSALRRLEAAYDAARL